MTRYHMAVDSGGTKCSAVLYDDEYRLLAYTVQGSVRTSTTPPALCWEHIQKMVEELRQQCPAVSVLTTLHGALDQKIADQIAQCIPYEKFYAESETRLCLASAGIDAPGLICLSGTGQFASYVDADGVKRESMGAYGAMLYDEGSGYHIGRLALSAAIHYDEGYGEPTSLRDAIRRQMDAPTFREAVFRFGSLADGSGVITRVAALSRLVGEEAGRGDHVSQEILRAVGKTLGQQMNGLIRNQNVPDEVPVVVAGGVFRGHPLLLDTFTKTVHEEHPAREIRQAMFEPIVGAVLAHAFDAGETEKIIPFFLREYASLRLEHANKSES